MDPCSDVSVGKLKKNGKKKHSEMCCWKKETQAGNKLLISMSLLIFIFIFPATAHPVLFCLNICLVFQVPLPSSREKASL